MMKELQEFIKNIKTDGILRKLDDLGRVVIPIEYRGNKVKDGETKVDIYQIDEYVIIEILKNQKEETKRRFDTLGRIVVNIEIRLNLNWEENDFIEIWNFKNYFILKKKQNRCLFCKNSKDKLIEYKGKLICEKCKKDLSNTF